MSKFLFHAAFLAAISFLFFTNFKLNKAENERQFALERVVFLNEIARPIYLKEQKKIVGMIKLAAVKYSTPSNEKYVQNAVNYLACSNEFDKFINSSPENQIEIARKLTIMEDTILGMVENNKNFDIVKPSIINLNQNELGNLLAKLSPSELAYFNALAGLETKFRGFECLYYFMDKTRYMNIVESWFRPLVLQNPLNPKVGQKTTVEVTLSADKTRLDLDTKFFLDGKQLTNKGGKASFSKKFTKTGLQRFKIRGEWMVYHLQEDEVAATSNFVEKEFYINVPELH